MSGPRRPARASRTQAPSADVGLDGGVLLASGLLIGLGVVMSYSATAPLAMQSRLPPLFVKHVLALGLGGVAAFATMRMPQRIWRRIALPCWAVGVALLAATLLFGVEVNGARRWLSVPGLGLRFQPVEIVKLFTVIAIAALVARREGRNELSTGQLLRAAAVAIVPVLLLVLQPDFGSAILLFMLVVLLLFAAGAPTRLVVLPALASPLVVWLYAWVNPYAWRRLVSFWDPWRDSADAGFQLVQSFIAFAHGGLLGTGLGDGRQKLFYLPETHTDFILALIGEELGLLGVLGVLVAFVGLLLAGTRIAARAHDRFALLLAFGATALLTVPALVNAAVVMGLIPTKGLTLPFLSYGRTSLVVSCAALGLLLGIARNERPEPKTGISASRHPRLSWR